MVTRIPLPLKLLFPKRIWNRDPSEKTLYLTFDDGPIPEVTPWVLEQLERYSAKATFFCIGDNIRKHPEVFNKVIAAGHRVGNHSFNHLNGWKTPVQEYVQNVLLAEKLIGRACGEEGKIKLFRPPYGKITQRQARELFKENYSIVMWEVLSKDYNRELSEDYCYNKVLRNTRPGSIIVFHDSLKAEKNLRAVLPRVLEYYTREGFRFHHL